jgi:hypothetical protein
VEAGSGESQAGYGLEVIAIDISEIGRQHANDAQTHG